MREEEIKSEKERMAPEILIYHIFTFGDKFAGWCVVGHVGGNQEVEISSWKWAKL